MNCRRSSHNPRSQWRRFTNSLFVMLASAALLPAQEQKQKAQPQQPSAQPKAQQQQPRVLTQVERMEKWHTDPESFRAPAFAIATNLYYVGNKQFSSHLLVGTKEIVLFDTPYSAHFDMLTNSIRSVGVDPRKITLVLHTHAHYDHYQVVEKVSREIELKWLNCVRKPCVENLKFSRTS